MVINKQWKIPLCGMAGALLLSACATQADKVSDAGPEREFEALSEGEFESVIAEGSSSVVAATDATAVELTSRFYTVFFDLGADTLSDAGLDVVEEIAEEWGDDVAKLRLVGHTDSTGSRSFNQKLSERRAKAVRDALVERGIGAGRLIDGGAGETDLLVPTADGVPDGHNRRVTVTVEDN